MPQLLAASLRDLPSNTSAKASMRRAASASSVRFAASRRSAAARSFRVIATAATMLVPLPNQQARESHRRPRRNPNESKFNAAGIIRNARDRLDKVAPQSLDARGLDG